MFGTCMLSFMAGPVATLETLKPQDCEIRNQKKLNEAEYYDFLFI